MTEMYVDIPDYGREIDKLEALIREKHPDWNVQKGPMRDGYKIVLLGKRGGYICDVVCHQYSYGGKKGLLEWWNCKKGTEPIGYLSAEEALALFEKSETEKALKGRKKITEDKNA